VNLLRQIEVAMANGKTTAQASKEAEIGEQKYFHWRKEYGGLQMDQRRLRELEQENAKLKRLVAELNPGQTGVERHRGGKLLSPARRRCAVSHACEHGVSEPHACLLLGQAQRHTTHRPMEREDEDALTQAIVVLASQYGAMGIAGSRHCSSAGWPGRQGPSRTDAVAKG
jgi:putative transposase